MKIDYLKAYRVQIPFLLSIDHHLKKRQCSEAFVVAIHTKDGTVGYGEGAPRVYVTGETHAEVLDTFEKACTPDQLPTIETLEDIKVYSAFLRKQYQMPSLVAAVEMALLDILGQEKNRSIGSFLGQNQSPLIPYSGVLPYLSDAKLDQYLQLVKSLGLTQVKLKVGHANDFRHLERARAILGPAVDIRIDANRAWTLEEAVSKLEKLAAFDISCVEEPLQESAIHQLPKLSRMITTPILLDESVFNLKQAHFYADQIEAKQLLFNLKISKSGGLIAASELYHFATTKGIACQLGCNVGETAILSAAGRIFAQTHKLRYLEGSFAPFFMEDDISTKPLSFSKKGIAPKLVAPGLGISIDTKKLHQYSSTSKTIQAATL